MGVFNILYKSLTILRLSRWLLSAFGVKLIFEILLNLFGASQVDRKLCRLLLLGWLYRLGEDLGISFKKWWHSQLARGQEAWTISESLSLFFFTWKALASAKVSLRAVCLESQTKARHSKGCLKLVLVIASHILTSSIFNINIICTNHMYACPYAISISSIISTVRCSQSRP